MSKHAKEQIIKGTRIEVYNSDVSKALRKLKKKLADDGLMQELRQREYFESKGTKRRKAKEAAIRRYKKQRTKDDQNW
jgi:small subunit ribosomal protein S21